MFLSNFHDAILRLYCLSLLSEADQTVLNEAVCPMGRFEPADLRCVKAIS